MKKVIFSLICFFLGTYFVNADGLVSEALPYFVKISKWGSEPLILNVKKVYDKDTLEGVFNVNINNYDVSDNFNVYSEYDINTWKIPKTAIPFFNTIIYYGYLQNPSDLNYFYTQILIWSRIFNYTIQICDEAGNNVAHSEEYIKLITLINNHITQSGFFNKTYNFEIWTTNYFQYQKGVPILDNPIIDGLVFSNEDNNLSIYNDRVGNYILNFTKEYEQETICYYDGINTYLRSLKGPQNISYKMNYNVYGTKLNIIENLIGINNRYGDAYLDSDYELYLNDELKLTIDNFDNLYVKSNSNYLLKDISNSNGINNIDDINFQIENDEHTLVIDKYVISKNISLNIKDNKTYYVYLKSNDELYEIIDSKTDLITLPYGTYYILNEDNTYYQEILVENNQDEEIVIEEKIIVDNEIVEELTIEEEKIIVEEVKQEEEKNSAEIEKEEIDKDDEVIIEEINNPKTLDDIDFYKLAFILSSCLLFLMFGLLRLII